MSTPKYENEAKHAAESFRKQHGLGTGPILDLIRVVQECTECEITVLETPDGEDGLTMRDPKNDRSYIALSQTNVPLRQRTTLAHELAHYLFADHSPALTDNDYTEKRATSFARHLLIPYSDLTAFAQDKDFTDQKALSDVVQHYLVSPQMALIALHDLKLISEEQKNAHWDTPAKLLATRYGWSEELEALAHKANSPKSPTKLVTRAIQAYQAGVITLEMVANVRGITPEALLEEFKESEITPNTENNNAFVITDLPDLPLDQATLNAIDALDTLDE